MKNTVRLLVVVTLVAVLAPAAAFAAGPDDPFVTTLYAGQHIDVGQVSVWNDANNVYVCYDTDGWMMTETHLAVADTFEGLPQRNGNPSPGQFPYKHEDDDVDPYHDCFTLPVEWAPESELFMAAHAVVCSEEVPGETTLDDCGFTLGDIAIAPLVAGQHIDTGNVTVAVEYIDGEYYLVVTYTTTGDWGLNETHLAVAHSLEEIPQKNGNPIPGRFPYKHEGLNGATVDTFVIPFADLMVNCDDVLYIAAHASVSRDDGSGEIQQETAWGGGEPFPGKNWAMYFTATVTCECGNEEPPEPVCETAWGDGEDFPGNNWATYFTYTLENLTRRMLKTARRR